jgi:predicted ATPase
VPLTTRSLRSNGAAGESRRTFLAAGESPAARRPAPPQGQSALAAADFREAIALAQKMGAKALELRATVSLARPFASQGHRDEARTMLADIYNWFTEGFDTVDLKEAKALLEEL